MSTRTTKEVKTDTTTTVTTITIQNDSNWNWKVWVTVGWILCITLISLYFFQKIYHKVDNGNKTVSEPWKGKSLIEKPTPSWFTYDIKVGNLMTQRPIDEDDKKLLVTLMSDTADGYKSYVVSLNNLAFKSNIELKSPYLDVLFLTALCGTIGVILRTANNLVGVACWKNDFDFDVWWPWYFLRPLIGFIVGPIVFIIIDGKILPFNSFHSYGSVLTIAVSILAGFGAEDVLNALRAITKRIFSPKE